MIISLIGMQNLKIYLWLRFPQAQNIFYQLRFNVIISVPIVMLYSSLQSGLYRDTLKGYRENQGQYESYPPPGGCSFGAVHPSVLLSVFPSGTLSL